MPPALPSEHAYAADKDRLIDLFHEALDLREDGFDDAAVLCALQIECSTLRRLALDLLRRPLSFTKQVVQEDSPLLHDAHA